ncbi:methyltransferase [Gallaecimonas sp. GXIMD4217]|uniref:methyltransferase n=1 Tax=Gallaecimonas sp. GXIMD4217 TaxID=3131927 RepID=UPI00311B15EF
MAQDRYFTDLAHKFTSNIYGSYKGAVRQHLLWRDLDALLAQLPPGLSVLDVGGGAGQTAIGLCQRGHRVRLVEPAAEMLALAREAAVKAGCTEALTLEQLPLQQLDGQYQLVVFHAVLEWLADQRGGLGKVVELVGPGGWLSLLFYNKNAMDFMHLIRGNFQQFNQGWYGRHKGLTPQAPLDPRQVLAWLAEAGMEVMVHTGIRCFSDFHLPDRPRPALEEVLAMEEKVSGLEPYRSLARYVHILARKPG